MTDVLSTPRSGLDQTPRTPFKARVARAILRPAVSRTPVRVTFPDGRHWGAGGPDAPEMVVHRPAAFFNRLGQDSKIGLGEAYMAGDWSAGEGTDLADLLSPFAAQMATLVPPSLQKLRRLVDRDLPAEERNTVSGSRSNIERHYDLSNDLFLRFLDPSMTYSSAWFEDLGARPGFDDLEGAQQRKLDGLLDQAGVTEGTRVLEIGSGWGSLAIRAAQRGAHVTTITISTEQAALARRRFAEAGVDDRIELRLQDYRDVTGEYDAVVSCEMIEAVGEEYWPTYFATIDSVLAPGGRVAIQTITMEHHRYQATRRSYGWIQKYIFPGGLIPSRRAVDETLAEHTSGLRVTEARSLGLHYARTLRLWRERFEDHWQDISTHGFDETFRRMWTFYLAYCEAGFAVGYLDVEQLQMQHA